MINEPMELEMRVEGLSGPEGIGRVEAAIREIDPEAKVRVDPATGIVHATTRSDTLEVVAALSRAGLEATAMTM